MNRRHADATGTFPTPVLATRGDCNPFWSCDLSKLRLIQGECVRPGIDLEDALYFEIFSTLVH